MDGAEWVACMMVFQVSSVSLWPTELKKKLRLRVLAGSEVEANLIRTSRASSTKVFLALYCAVRMCFALFSPQRRRTSLKKKLPSWIRLGKAKLHSVCRPHAAHNPPLCLKSFVWILNMQWCLSALVLTLIKLQNELKALQHLIFLTDNPKRLAGEDENVLFHHLWLCCSPLTAPLCLHARRAAESVGGEEQWTTFKDCRAGEFCDKLRPEWVFVCICQGLHDSTSVPVCQLFARCWLINVYSKWISCKRCIS